MQAPKRLSGGRPDEIGGGKGNVDCFLYKNLVEIVPLVESLMDQKANSSFNRRASVIYTPTPARDSLTKKETKVRRTSNVPSKKLGDDHDLAKIEKKVSEGRCADDMTASSFRKVSTKNELEALRKEMGELRNNLLEKDEIIKSAQEPLDQLSLAGLKIDELVCEAAEKDSLVKVAQMQLSDSQASLADKQASLEKLQLELIASKKESEKLEHDLDDIEWETGILVQAIKSFTGEYLVDNEEKHSNLDYLDNLPAIKDEELIDEIELQQMENARLSYISALAYAKENPSEASLALAAEARQRLTGFA